MTAYFVGLMSGTSADGIDAAVVAFDSAHCQLIGSHSQSFTGEMQARIHGLADGQQCTLEQLCELDIALGEAFAKCALRAIENSGLQPHQIAAIGSHGQTVRHRPQSATQTGLSLQIGDPNTIAERTGITTVADFRRRDIAAGGQGAPLAPGFHAWAMGAVAGDARALVNIGGISNLTWLPQSDTAIGYDLGPGNVLMDAWTQRHLGQAYDAQGQWAASGQLDPTLLQALLAHPFFSAPAPKSTGRELFNIRWLDSVIAAAAPDARPQDVQRTLCELTAIAISSACETLDAQHLYVCGGGAHNPFLMNRLSARLPGWQVASTSALGIDPQWVEAMAFAWLAHQRLAGAAGNLCSVTGAQHPTPLGAIYAGSL